MTGAIPYPHDPAQEVRAPVDPLREFIVRVLVKKSMFQFDAQTAADRMIEADLRGLAGCGCRQLIFILDAMDSGDIDPRARVLVEHETAAAATLDGSRAVGQVAATKAMDLAIKKAQEVGTGTVAVHHSLPLGAASLYPVIAARAGLIGFCTSNSGGAAVVAPGSASPIAANAAWAWAFPSAEGSPIVVDFATGAASLGKLHALARYGLPLPPGVGLDAAGLPTTDPHAASAVQPAAGGRGFGLALVASLLSGGLAGGKLPHQKTRPGSAESSEHLLMAIDVAHFTDRDRFLARADELRHAIGELTAIDAADPPHAPGDRGWKMEQDRRESGIPLHRTDAAALAERAGRLRIELPW